MSEIPEDVMAAARAALHAIGLPADHAHDVDTVARAILAERKRCAAVARDSYANIQEGGAWIGCAIAEAIEAGA